MHVCQTVNKELNWISRHYRDILLYCVIHCYILMKCRILMQKNCLKTSLLKKKCNNYLTVLKKKILYLVPVAKQLSYYTAGSCFRGFEEGPLTFAPTYKYDPGTQIYDSSPKQRTPSYTDRILYKHRRGTDSGSIACVTYASVPDICTSDHKPVWGLYRCPVRPGIDTWALTDC